MKRTYAYQTHRDFVEVKIKRLSEQAVIPKYAKAEDAGLDLTATSLEYTDKSQIVYGTGLAVEIPVGYYGMLVPRSSIHKTGLSLANSVGIIDSGYRGEIRAVFSVNSTQRKYEIGDRIAQLIVLPYPTVSFIETDSLSDSERKDAGFGSSGR